MTQTPLMKYLLRCLSFARSYSPLVCVIVFAWTASGCSRSFWRKQADTDAYEVIGEKQNDQRWMLPRVDLTADPDSRFYDPYDPDFGPLPPDDPAANVYMHYVDGMRGSKSWHKMGESMSIENPQWLMRYGLTPAMMNPDTQDYTGQLPELKGLTLADCVELSQMHSRELQSQLEDLYLTALDVTWQRFQFDVRYLGIAGNEPTGVLVDSIVPNGPGDKMRMAGAFGVTQLLPAGGQIVAELTNNTLWLFTSPNSTSSNSALSYAVVQPLLFGAGRKVVLEKLTQSERDLLYKTRTLARFRQTLFTNVASDNTGSYLNLIQQIQVIRNQQQNIERLRNQVAMMQSNASQRWSIARAELSAMPNNLVIPPLLKDKLKYSEKNKELTWLDASMSPQEEAALTKLSQDPSLPPDSPFLIAANELIQGLRTIPTPLDVLQLKGNLAQAINTLRNQERVLQDSLDSLKLVLGLPTDIMLTIDDSMLKPFEVIDPRLKSLESEVTDFINIWAEYDEENPSTDQLFATSSAFSNLLKRVDEVGFSILDEDVEKLRKNLDARIAELDNEEDQLRVRSDVERDFMLLEDARARLKNLEREVLSIDERIRINEEGVPMDEDAPIEVIVADDDSAEVRKISDDSLELFPKQERRIELLKSLKVAHEGLLQVTRSLTVVEIGTRVEQIGIADFDISQEQVVLNAVENRLDLMNQKAIVTDARRKMEVLANRLMATVNFVLEGDIRNAGGPNPVDFAGKYSEIRTGVRFTAPLVRVQQRNEYRASLIAYQRARRDYMALEDQVKQQVRRNWRQLSVQKRNLETSRLQLRLAARQYESAVDEAMAPAQPGAASRSGLLGTNLIQALNSVVSAQNSLIQNWVTYEQNRLGIYRDMGIMEIGPDGMWNDPVYRRSADQETQEELPGRQSLPDAEPDDGTEEAVPIPENNDGLGLLSPLRFGRGWNGQTDRLVEELDGAQQAGLHRTRHQARREETVSDQLVRAGLS
ncbi:MAG: TolC family protein [Planctomycetaceae bacterium]